MTKRERTVWILLGVVFIIALAVPAKGLFVDGVYSWHIRQPEFIKMGLETAGLALILGPVWLFVDSCPKRILFTGLICMAFVWCHVVFLPMLVSFAYVLYLCLVGHTLRSRIIGCKMVMSDGWMWEFLLGCAFVITLFCMMSAAGVGSIPLLTGAVAVTGLVAVAASRRDLLQKMQDLRRQAESPEVFSSFVKAGRKQKTPSWSVRVVSLLFVFMIVMILIQVGRMNISLDFDSLWYGLRSEYILDNGRGIYENMGSVGLVYTYSKGLEVLLLPLSGMASHSYLLFFNVWIAVMTLAAVYRIGCFYMGRTYALLASACVSSIPAIMNMSITAKTDSITLFTQLVMILCMLHYLREKKKDYLFAAFGAFLLSWTLKPTAVIFSTAVFGMGLLYFVAKRQFSLRAGWRVWMQLLVLLSALAGIWARTVSMVGIPVTSVFSSIFLKLGFVLKYPFSAAPINGNVMEKESILRYLTDTLYRIFLNPTGENMSHVMIAWGTSLIFFLPVVSILAAVLRKRGAGEKLRRADDGFVSRTASQDLLRFAHTVMVPFVLVCLVSLLMLGQIDGNYFMLLDVGIVLYGCAALSHVDGREPKRSILLMMAALLMFNVPVTMVSNWAWSLGFTPVSIVNKGRMNHRELEHQDMIKRGNTAIWNILEEDPKTRVIAVGDHPQIFEFPCNVQSYDDITSTWGNVRLVKTMDNFVEYLTYAKTDYIYMQAQYLERESRCYELMGYLIEAGIMTDIVYENGNILARVDLEGVYGSRASEAYRIYLSDYPTESF